MLRPGNQVIVIAVDGLESGSKNADRSDGKGRMPRKGTAVLPIAHMRLGDPMKPCPGSCLLCYANARKRENHKGHFGYRVPSPAPKKKEQADMRKPTQGKATVPGKMSLEGCDMEKQYPTLFEMITEQRWDSGEERRTSTLLIFLEDGLLKACVNDRALNCSLFLAGDSLAGLLSGVEAALRDGTAVWRPHRRV